MVRKLAARLPQWLGLSLVFVLFICQQSGVRAADPKDVAYVTMVFRAAVVTNTINPLQAAIAEADAIDCLDNGLRNVQDPTRDECILNSVPPAYIRPMTIVDIAVRAARYYLPGTWATYSTYPGQGTVSGSLTITDNMGTLTASAGTATFAFYQCTYTDPDCMGEHYVIYVYRTSTGDVGRGVLLQSDDGCLMYGAFRSDKDLSTTGNFLMARC